MAAIGSVEIRMVNLIPKTKRVDAIQSFVSQETPIVRIADADGPVGVGDSYTPRPAARSPRPQPRAE